MTHGTWWRADPVMVDGELAGRRLAVGAAGERRARIVDLDPESFAAGPFDGRILTGTDDGALSIVSLIDPGHGCATEVDRSADIIRRATITPDRPAILEFRLERTTRAELGVFRVPLAGTDTAVRRIVDPIDPDVRFGPTWTTEFSWSDDGEALAIQSCGAVACRTRVVGPDGHAIALLDDPSHGDLVGLAAGHIVLHAACGGLPCPLLSIGIGSGVQATLDDAAGQATTMTGIDGSATVIYEHGDDLEIRAVDPRGGVAREVASPVTGRRLVPAATRADAAIDLAPGTVLLGPDGALSLDGATPPVVLRVDDGVALDIDEVIR